MDGLMRCDVTKVCRSMETAPAPKHLSQPAVASELEQQHTVSYINWIYKQISSTLIGKLL